jgi:mannobiose 2-epimerase
VRERQQEILDQTRAYFVDTLLPFWVDRSPDPEAGGFLTHFDRDGNPSGATTKTFLMQIRMLLTMSSAHRAGYGDGRCAELASMGADFLLAHYWDEEHGGWYWNADRNGSPTDIRKIGYGQCFAMYSFGEYFLATGDPRGREAMQNTYDVVMSKMADTERGGYFEIMERDWTPGPPDRGGGDRKSFDVHMHMMESLTKVCEVTGDAAHRDRLADVIALLTGKMLDSVHGLGIQQFSLDFEPRPAIRFDVEWGRDAEPETGSIPVSITSYGHNVEFAWLLLLAADVLGIPHERYEDIVRTQSEHCLRYGIDGEHGGVYIDGPVDAPTANGHKQFWQQAEVLIGALAAVEMFADDRYWNAFLNVYDFVFDKFVHMPGGGEWFHKVDRDGTVLEDHLADDYKVSYHTVRAMIEVVRRLERL